MRTTCRHHVALILLLLCHPAQARMVRHTIKASQRGVFDATTTYSTLSSGSPLARLANHTLSHWARTQQRAFVTLSRQDFKDRNEGSRPYDQEVDFIYHRYSPTRLFSISFEVFEDTGGAHPNTNRVTFNFGRVNGQPKQMTLRDFFRPSSSEDSRRRVQSALLAKLHKDDRAEFISEYKSLTPAQLNRFVVEADGLRFYFDPYEVGSYAAGPIDVKLNLRDLGPNFNRSLLSAQ